MLKLIFFDHLNHGTDYRGGKDAFHNRYETEKKNMKRNAVGIFLTFQYLTKNNNDDNNIVPWEMVEAFEMVEASRNKVIT